VLLYEDKWGSGINGQLFVISGAGMFEWRVLLSWEKQGYCIVWSPAEFCNLSQVAAAINSLLPYPATNSDPFVHDGKKCNVYLCFDAVIVRISSKIE